MAVDPLQTGSNLVRLGVVLWWRGAELYVQTGVHVGARVTRAARDGESPAQVIGELTTEARDVARRLLLGLLEDGVPVPAPKEAVVVADPPARAGTNGRAPAPADPARELARRGAELLARAADVRAPDDAHPAYARILDELAPDEARMLRFLAAEGAQPSVDVRTGKALIIGGQLIAPGLTMIGNQAGCRYLDRSPAYLNNLFRLGLIWFSREALEDPTRYQVLEAQPEVVEALGRAGRGRTVRRSIMLTPFGEDFCSVCLPRAASRA